MKRFFLIVPIILCVLLNACSPPPENINPTPTNVPNPITDAASTVIFNDLNMAIETIETSIKSDQLAHIHGPSYQVIGVYFKQENNVPAILFVQTRCECAENGSCCDPNLTFAMTLRALETSSTTNNYEIIHTVQSIGTVNMMKVLCYDHKTLTNEMSVPWVDVVGYLQNSTNGFQLLSKVTPNPQP